jgi:hypothetical protein
MSTAGGPPVDPGHLPGVPATPGVPHPPPGPPAPPPGPPAPPPGPGVTPPFTAPPSDRNRRGLWIGLGAGALVLVLCCIGGLASFGLLLVGTDKQMQTKATQVVRGYLDAVQTGDYGTAYSYLCSSLKRQGTESEFAAAQAERPRLVAYVVHKPQIGNLIIVPADLRYEDGTSMPRRFELKQESGSQELRICRGA